MTPEQQIAELSMQAKSIAFSCYLRRGRVPGFLAKLMRDILFAEALLQNRYKAEQERVPAGSFDGGEFAPGGGNKHPGVAEANPDAASVTKRLKDTLAPGGKPIGKAGSDSTIRQLPGGKQAAEKMISDLSKGGIESTPPDLAARGGVRYTMPGESYITYRPISKSGPPTIDINFGGSNTLRGIVEKLKYPDEVE